MFSIGILPNSNQKARIICTEKGEYLVSYETTVLFRDNKGKLFRTWSDWTQTTGRHIKEFCGLNKSEYKSLPYKEV